MLADWNLSVPAIENDLAKSRLVWRMLDRLKLLDEFKIDPKILANFMNDVRVLYVKNRNPFHNYDHAVQGKLQLTFQYGRITMASYACFTLYAV